MEEIPLDDICHYFFSTATTVIPYEIRDNSLQREVDEQTLTSEEPFIYTSLLRIPPYAPQHGIEGRRIHEDTVDCSWDSARSPDAVFSAGDASTLWP